MNPWINTFTGRQFFPLSPRPEDICIEDIAHALSMQCRFTGHVRRFYSVAQHSVLVASQVAKEHRLAALLHDASEAYLVDLARPIKHSPAFAPFRKHEAILEAAIAQRFGFLLPLHASIKDADQRMLATEAHSLIAKHPSWDFPYERYPEVDIIPWAPTDAEDMFLEIFAHATV